MKVERCRKLLRIFALCLMCFGLWVTVYNLRTFAIGYFAPEKQIGQKGSLLEHQMDTRQLYKERPLAGERLGQLIIPKLEKTYPVFEGTEDSILKKGVGHYRTSALPGEKNNSILSGHRDTVFRELGEIEEKDELIVSMEAGSFLYKVKKIRIVDKYDRTVIVPRPEATLTLTTCYPFHYVGNAPKRYVIEADFIAKIE